MTRLHTRPGPRREATTRFNIAMVLQAQGQLQEAVAELEVVVDLDRAVQHPNLKSDTASAGTQALGVAETTASGRILTQIVRLALALQ